MITNQGIDGYELGLITCEYCFYYDKLNSYCDLLGNRDTDGIISDDDDASIHVSVKPTDFCSFGKME